MSTINKLPKNKGFIFSVYRNDKPMSINEIAFNEVACNLTMSDIPFKEVEKKCTTDKGYEVIEKSFYIDANKKEYDRIKKHIETLCTEHKQNSYLYLNEERNAYLVNSKSESSLLGKFTNVSKLEALDSDDYTYDQLTESYFIVR